MQNLVYVFVNNTKFTLRKNIFGYTCSLCILSSVHNLMIRERMLSLDVWDQRVTVLFFYYTCGLTLP